MRTPTTQSGWIIENDGSPHGNFEAIFACPVTPTTPSLRGLFHQWWDNGGLSDPTSRVGAGALWTTAETITNDALPGPWFGAALLKSSFGNLEIVAAHADGRLAHFWLAGVFGWQGPTFLPGVAAGPPAFIQSRFGATGNFEVIVPRPGGGLSHFFRDNDHGQTWHTAPDPTSAGTWAGVGLIHSSFGNLELVGALGNGSLAFMFQAGAGGPWSAPLTLATGMRGRPALIQSRYGRVGNFEVVVSDGRDGGLVHLWRDNDAATLPWSAPIRVPPAGDGRSTIYDDVTMLQSSFGALEVHARPMRENTLDWFRAAHAAPWTLALEGAVFPCT